MSNIHCEACRLLATDRFGEWYVCERAPREIRLASPAGLTLVQARLEATTREELPLLVGALARGLVLQVNEVRLLAATLLLGVLVADRAVALYLPRHGLPGFHEVLRGLFSAEQADRPEGQGEET